MLTSPCLVVGAYCLGYAGQHANAPPLWRGARVRIGPSKGTEPCHVHTFWQLSVSAHAPLCLVYMYNSLANHVQGRTAPKQV